MLRHSLQICRVYMYNACCTRLWLSSDGCVRTAFGLALDSKVSLTGDPVCFLRSCMKSCRRPNDSQNQIACCMFVLHRESFPFKFAWRNFMYLPSLVITTLCYRTGGMLFILRNGQFPILFVQLSFSCF